MPNAKLKPRTHAPFEETHWTIVMAAAQKTPRALEALEKLCHAYWLPLYAYVRRQGHSPHDAEDLTQEFFASILARGDLALVHPDKGKFRTFLLACLQHFLANDRRKRQTLKRGGGRSFVPFDQGTLEETLAADLTSDQSAERLFDRRFASAVLEQAMASLRAEMAAEGKGQDFEVLSVFLTDPGAHTAYDSAASRLGMSNGAISTSVHRLRKRYRELVRQTLAKTVSTPLELEEEMRYLLEVCG